MNKENMIMIGKKYELLRYIMREKKTIRGETPELVCRGGGV